MVVLLNVLYSCQLYRAFFFIFIATLYLREKREAVWIDAVHSDCHSFPCRKVSEVFKFMHELILLTNGSTSQQTKTAGKHIEKKWTPLRDLSFSVLICCP